MPKHGRKEEDLAGQRFGQVIALQSLGSKQQHVEWECLCLSCARKFTTLSANLKSGNTQRCQKCVGRKTSIEDEKKIYLKKIEGVPNADIMEAFGLTDKKSIYRIRDAGNTGLYKLIGTSRDPRRKYLD